MIGAIVAKLVGRSAEPTEAEVPIFAGKLHAKNHAERAQALVEIKAWARERCARRERVLAKAVTDEQQLERATVAGATEQLRLEESKRDAALAQVIQGELYRAAACFVEARWSGAAPHAALQVAEVWSSLHDRAKDELGYELSPEHLELAFAAAVEVLGVVGCDNRRSVRGLGGFHPTRPVDVAIKALGDRRSFRVMVDALDALIVALETSRGQDLELAQVKQRHTGGRPRAEAIAALRKARVDARDAAAIAKNNTPEAVAERAALQARSDVLRGQRLERNAKRLAALALAGADLTPYIDEQMGTRRR